MVITKLPRSPARKTLQNGRARRVQFAAALWIFAAVSGSLMQSWAQTPAESSSFEQTTLTGRQLEGLPNHLSDAANAIIGNLPKSPHSVLEARRRAAKAKNALSELLASEGYFSADVETSPIVSLADAPRFTIDPKQRFTIALVEMTGIEEVDSDTRELLESDLEMLPPGRFARTERIEGLDSALIQRLRRSGYAFAKSDTIDALASRQEATLELSYVLIPGPRIALGDIELLADTSISPGNIKVMQTWRRGDIYTPETLDTLRKRMRSAGLFDGIGVSVADAPDADGLYPIQVTYSKAKQRTISGGLSYSTVDGVGASASWSRRNITGRSDTLTAEAEVATITSHLELTYERPNIGRYGRDLMMSVGLRHEETDGYDLDGARASAHISQPFNKQFTITAGATIDTTRTRTVAQPSPAEQVSLSLPVNATYSTVETPLDPQQGTNAFLGVEPGISFGSGTGSFTRVTTSAKTYKQISPRLVGAVRVELGAFAGDDDVPPDRRFFSGGGGSVRGYAYQSLSPRDAENNPIGAASQFNISTELRWRKSDRYGYVVFIDTGAAADSLGAAWHEARSAIGAGVRYYPGFGPLRLDLATPIDRRAGEDPVHIYISIGQAF